MNRKTILNLPLHFQNIGLINYALDLKTESFEYSSSKVLPRISLIQSVKNFFNSVLYLSFLYNYYSFKYLRIKFELLWSRTVSCKERLRKIPVETQLQTTTSQSSILENVWYAKVLPLEVLTNDVDCF